MPTDSDYPFNAACFTPATKGTTAFPASCVPCAPQFGVTDPGNKTKRAPQKNTQRPAGTNPNAAQAPAAPAPNKAQNPATPPPNNANGAVPLPVPATKAKKPAGATRPAPRAICDINACTTALEPSFSACAPAVAQLGADALDDTLNLVCLAAAAKGPAAFPSTCDGCASQFGVTDPGAATATCAKRINKY
ncbi:hypothetical protein FB451DRAFT_1226879 [Mycena latifolia]|nr:hypothetical protein FB451DRAFT_1226879 [Mycena latifolia]